MGLGITSVSAASGRVHAGFWRAVVAIIVLHVLLVWTVRYEWQFSAAVRNGYAGFIVFHAALAAILASCVVSARTARRLIIAAFAVVTAGAVGAVFRYDAVAIYRVPVMLVAVAGLAGLVRVHVADRPARRSCSRRPRDNRRCP
jgi:hypothetical protein